MHVIIRGPELRLILMVLLLAATSGCALFRSGDGRPPELASVRAEVRAEAFGAMTIDGLFRAENDEEEPIWIEASECTLRLQDRPVATKTETTVIELRPGEIRDLPVTISIEAARVLDEIRRTSDDGILEGELQLALRYRVGAQEGADWVTATWEGDVRLLEIPRLELRDLRIESLSPLQADLEFVFDLVNPNRYDLRLMALDLACKINGTPCSPILADTVDQSIPPAETVTVRVRSAERLTGDDNALFRLLRHESDLEVEVSGTATFSFDSPLAPLPAPVSTRSRVQP